MLRGRGGGRGRDSSVQKCKSACGLCKGESQAFQVAGAGLGWLVAAGGDELKGKPETG